MAGEGVQTLPAIVGHEGVILMAGPSILPHVLEHPALDEADLRARVVELEGDVATYRDLLCEALAVLHDLQVEHKRVEARYHHALEQNRRLREELPRKAA